MRARQLYSVRHWRLWLLAIVVVVLAAVSSAAAQMTTSRAWEGSTLLAALFDTERGSAYAP